MVDDEKAAFYLRHHKQIREWTALRPTAASMLDAALHDAFARRAGDVDFVDLTTGEAFKGVTAALPVEAAGARVDVGLWWLPASLFGQGWGGWPQLGVWSTESCPRGSALFAAVKDATRVTAKHLQLSSSGRDWIWYHHQVAHAEPLDVDAYADRVVETLRQAREQLAPPILETLRRFADH